MTTIERITLEQLTKSETLEKIKAEAQDYIIHEQMPDAWNLTNRLETQTKRLIDSAPEIYKQYQKIIAQLKFAAIPFLIDEQVFELIEKYFLAALKEELYIEKRIRAYLASKSVFARDQFKTDIISRLKENKEKIGIKTIGEWLSDYDKFAGARKNTSIERAKFIAQDVETDRLTIEPKQHLSQLLEFYDNIKISVPLPLIGVSEITLKEFFREAGISLPEEEKKPLPRVKIIPPEELIKEPEPIEPLKLKKPIKEKKPSFFKRLFGKKPKEPKPPQPKAGPPQAEKKKEEPKPEEIIPPKIKEAAQRLKKIPSIYEGKISPYERKGEAESMPLKEEKKPTHIGRIIPLSLGPPAKEEIPTFPEKEIPTFSKKTEEEVKKLEKKAKKTSFRLVRAKQKEEKKPKAPPTILKKVDIKGKYHIRTMKKDIEKVKQTLPKPEVKVKNNIVDLSGK